MVGEEALMATKIAEDLARVVMEQTTPEAIIKVAVTRIITRSSLVTKIKEAHRTLRKIVTLTI